MAEPRNRGISDWKVDLEGGWYPVLLDAGIEDREWAQTAVEAVRELVPDAGVPGGIVGELVDLRAALRSRGSAFLQAAVYIRPESVYTIGCVATSDIVLLDDEDDEDAYETLLLDSFARPAPGVRTMDSATWRDRITAGGVVGGYQRYDERTPGAVVSVGYERILYGVFPERSRDMIQLDFTTADLGAFRDMREETTALLAGITVETEAIDR